MTTFAKPRAISKNVAETLHTHGHHTVLDQIHQGARTYRIERIVERGAHDGEDASTPQSLTLIFEGRDRTRPSQLYLDHLAVPSRFWSWDADLGVLTWNFQTRGVDHAGRLAASSGASRLLGSIHAGDQSLSVLASLAPVTYDCDVALNTGALVMGTPPALSLHWNTSDPRWTSATWVKSALLFSWQVEGQIYIGKPTYDVAINFKDEQTSSVWTPDPDTMSTLLDANYRFTMTLAGGYDPNADDRSHLAPPANHVTSVFPYMIAFDVTPDGSSITGAALTTSDSQAGQVLGVRGTVTNPNIAGLYTLPGGDGHAIFSVHGGALHIHGEPIAGAHVQGDAVSWSGLSDRQSQLSGLPSEGRLAFTSDGCRFRLEGRDSVGRRLKIDQAHNLLAGTPNASHPIIESAAQVSAVANTLNIPTLSNMTQFAFKDNVWIDAVQQATLADFNNVLLYYMPNDLRQTYYNTGQPTLPSWLQAIAAQGDNPAGAYQNLATAFLTNIISTWNEDGADQLNALRAQAWLKTQTAASPTLQLQIAAIYAHEFPNQPQNQALPQFLLDQKQKQSQYSSFIAADAASWKADLNKEIVDPDALKAMLDIVNNLSVSAISNGLYWAYVYFRYITKPSALMLIQMISLGNATDLDGSAFMRECQRNVALLSQLDSSNNFADQYMSVIQTFQIGNLLPALFDYSGNPEDYVWAIQQVLKQIAAIYQNNSDPDIAQAAQEAQALIASGRLGDLIAVMQGAAAGRAGIYGWAQLAPLMAQSVAGKIGVAAANLLCLGLAGVGMMSIVFGVMNWKSLDAAQQVEIAVNGAHMAIQLLTPVLKRGVSIGAVLEPNATYWDTIKTLFKSDLVAQADSRLQSGFSKWVVSSGAVEPESEMFGNLFSEAAAEDESLVSKVFGKNLDEFLATRIGACVAVINLVIGILMAIKSKTPLEAAGNWLLVAASGLDVLAIAGGWALGALGVTTIGGLAVATICTVLSVLAIVAAIAGVIILLYLAFKATPTPAQQFGDDYAKAAGFFMQYASEIDYFNGYIPTSGITHIGLSLSLPGDVSTVLKIGTAGAVSTGPFDYSYDTTFYVTTNGQGQSQLSALAPDANGLLTRYLLTASGSTATFAVPLPATDPNAGSQQWSIVLQGDATKDGDHPLSGPFSLSPFGSGNGLSWSNNSLVIGAARPNWTITQQPMACAGLKMNDIVMYTFSQGQSFTPSLQQVGSTPKTWSITPALPSFLQLDTASGVISETPSAPNPLPVTPAASFTLSVSNAVTTSPLAATFKISVIEFAG